jgi:hypothetical protein
MAIVISILLAVFLFSGCIGENDNFYMYIQYEAYYNAPLSIDEIEKIFSEANISFDRKYTYTDVISFSFGKGINEARVEPTYAILYPEKTYGEYPAILNIELNGSEYPRPHWTDDYKNINENRKPILKESMNYIVNLIKEATGMMPVNKEFKTGDGAQIT